MGLLENVFRHSKKLGLGPKLVRFLPFISLLAFLSGFIYLAILPIDGQYRHTYVSENALLPKQANTYFRESEWFITRGFRGNLQEIKDLPEHERNLKLAELFNDMAIKVATHTYNTTKLNDKGEFETGENFYAIMHAPRGSHNEAIAIVAPWLAENGVLNDGALSILPALAHYFRRWSVWHKNIIFVVPSNGNFALRQWVEAYHTTLEYTAGSIEGALVLEFASPFESFDHIDVSYDGLNGQQPNLDLINVVVDAGDQESVTTFIQNMGSSPAVEPSQAFTTYRGRLYTMLRGVKSQLLAGIRYNSGSEMFSGYRIDAISLRARGFNGGAHDITTYGRVVESTVRSINNLLEHFHQSFFFYLLLGPRQFVSIGTYVPAVLLAANSFILSAAHELLITAPATNKDIAFALGFVAGVFAIWATFAGFTAEILESNAILGGFVAALALLAIFARNTMTPRSRRIAHAFGLILTALGLTAMSALHFALAGVAAVLMYPLAWVNYNKRSDKVLVILSCPIVLLSVLSMAVDQPLNELLQQLLDASETFGIWAWRLVVLLWFPVWYITLVSARHII